MIAGLANHVSRGRIFDFDIYADVRIDSDVHGADWIFVPTGRETGGGHVTASGRPRLKSDAEPLEHSILGIETDRSISSQKWELADHEWPSTARELPV
jgi:hypothetical protein